ncbi:MAG: hypothetical protein KDD51_09795, partial [Bdellovibrionales bacterium]|nr:hypothetical protein [Bdellovibrionales bacterium]
MGPQLRRVHAIVLARGAHATQAAAIVDAIKLRFWLTYELVSGSLFRDVAAVLNPNEVLDSSTHAIVADIIRTSNGHWALPFTLTCVSNADPNPNPNPNPNPSFARPERDIDRFALAGPILQVLLRPTPEVVRRLSQIDLGYWKDTVTENQTLPGSPGTNTARVAVGDMDVADDIFHVSAGPDAPRAPAQGLGVPSSKEDYAL